MKKMLVTGGCGFIGSNFIRYILNVDSSIKIINLDKLTYAGNELNLSGLSKNRHKLIIGDVCDSNLIDKLFLKYKFDVVVHFAAESHVDRSIDGPMNFIQTNVIGTLVMLESARKFIQDLKIKNFRFIHISTDEVYGSLSKTGKFTENTSYDPSSPYSASKASSDHIVRAWNRTYGLPILITNCSNNYGPYQFPEKLIPLTIINCLKNKALPIYGKGENIRDWLFVEDHCDAIYNVLKDGEVGETYNIGGNNEIKNLDIVLIICKLMDEIKPREDKKSFSDLIQYVEDRPGHDFRYAIDANKIKSKLGWTPSESFQSGIKKTIEWYLNNQEWLESIYDNTYRQSRLGILRK